MTRVFTTPGACKQRFHLMNNVGWIRFASLNPTSAPLTNFFSAQGTFFSAAPTGFVVTPVTLLPWKSLPLIQNLPGDRIDHLLPSGPYRQLAFVPKCPQLTPVYLLNAAACAAPTHGITRKFNARVCLLEPPESHADASSSQHPGTPAAALQKPETPIMVI